MDARDDNDANAQAEYDADPGLQGLLSRGAESPTLHRDRADGVDDGHRERVNDSAGRALTEHAEVLKRLNDADTGNDGDGGTTE